MDPSSIILAGTGLLIALGGGIKWYVMFATEYVRRERDDSWRPRFFKQ
jgi:uncharacterized membrane-anchored protein